MRDRWTDERMDDLKGSIDVGFRHVDDRFKQVDERFDRVDDRFDRFEAKCDREFGRLNDRLDGLQKLIAQFAVSFTAATLVGFAAVFTAIMTRL